MPAAAPTADTSAPFSLPVRVYWEDTDAGGIVYYANYLKLFERARTEWLRTLGFSQQRLLDGERVMFVVTDATLRCIAPARLDDRLDLTVRVSRAGGASLEFAQQAQRDGTLLAAAEIRVGCVQRGDDTLRASRIPAAILRALV
jgi:acyl-CoA thioester hydrolase